MHKYDIIKLLDIQEGLVKKIEKVNNSIYIYLETVAKLNCCPSCKEYTKNIHDYRIQKIQHIQINGITSYFILKKRRYICPHCGKIFYEYYPFLQKYFRKSNSVFNNIAYNAMQLKNIKTIAEDNNVSFTTVNRYIKYTLFLSNKYTITTFPKHIGIDEFKGNAGNEKYQVIITDLDTHNIVDIIESRKYDELEKYFSNILNRNDVTLVSMDLYSPFKRIIQDKFINAQIIADKFHYTRNVLDALDSIRIDVENGMNKHYRKYFKGIKRILMSREIDLTTKQKERLDTAFSLSSKLKRAYYIKEKFLFINDAIGADEKESLFREWLFNTENSKISEFDSCLKTLRAWHKYISNSFKYSLSNGPTEGKNNKIKVIKRISFGFKNFKNFRNRILMIA